MPEFGQAMFYLTPPTAELLASRLRRRAQRSFHAFGKSLIED